MFEKPRVLDGKTIAAFSRIYVEVQGKIKNLEAEKQDIKNALFGHFDLVQGLDSAAEIECGDGYKFTREIRVSKRIDEIELEEKLEPNVWKKITVSKRSIDETKLKKAIANDIVDKNIIKACVVKKKTYAFTHPSIKRAAEE